MANKGNPITFPQGTKLEKMQKKVDSMTILCALLVDPLQFPTKADFELKKSTTIYT